MKKPLRQVTERAESPAREADLRGIGQTAILADLPPLPYLFVRHSLDLPLIEIVKRHGLQAREHTHGHILHGKSGEHYKTMCVNLFVTALRIHQDHKHAELYLGHQDLLRETLVSNSHPLSGTHHFMAPHDLAFHHLNIPNFHGPLTVSPLHQIVLHQAGVPVQIHEHDHRFEHTELNDLYHGLISRFAAQTGHRKVSGE